MARGAGEPFAGADRERAGATDDDHRRAARLTLVDRPHVYRPPDDWDEDDNGAPPTWFAVLLTLLVVAGSGVSSFTPGRAHGER